MTAPDARGQRPRTGGARGTADARAPQPVPHGPKVVALGAAAALALVACGGDDTAAEGTGGASGDAEAGGGSSDATLVFGASADPVIIDGAYVSDGESLRVIRSIFEGLVTTEEGGT